MYEEIRVNDATDTITARLQILMGVVETVVSFWDVSPPDVGTFIKTARCRSGLKGGFVR
jgi:hypothetical protein